MNTFQTTLAIGMLGAVLSSVASHAAPSSATAAASARNPNAVYVCPMDMEPGREYDAPGYCPGGGMELVKKSGILRVAVLVYDGVENIDYAGPMEVFGASGATVFTVGPSLSPVKTVYGPKLQPDYDLQHAPQADVLLVPGGNVSAFTHDAKLMDWLRARNRSTRYVMSVCTGAFILGKAGLLDGISSTATATTLSQLAAAFPKTHVVRDRRFVDAGHIITTQGLTSGIDGALHLVERQQGSLAAQTAALYLEHRWQPDGTGAYGSLARMVLPDTSQLVPEHASWEKQFDQGDSQRWQMRGLLTMTLGSKPFLDNSVATLRSAGWTPRQGDATQRSFLKQVADGTWLYTIALTRVGSTSRYDLALAIRKVATPATIGVGHDRPAHSP